MIVINIECCCCCCYWTIILYQAHGPRKNCGPILWLHVLSSPVFPYICPAMFDSESIFFADVGEEDETSTRKGAKKSSTKIKNCK